VVFGYPPLSEAEALTLVESLKCEPLLAGYRGKPGVDKKALAALLGKVGALLLSMQEIGELDLNPVIYSMEKGCFVVADARIRRKRAY
jgi:hypothetical protein